MTKKGKNPQPQHGEIIIFTTEDKQSHLEVKLEQDTVWLTQKQIAELFKTERSVITKHLNNIFKSSELVKERNVQKMHIPFSDKPVSLYNLDVIISLGYKNNYLFKSTGEPKINDNTLVAIALLIAESKPKDKETMTALISNLLNEY